MQQWRLTIHGAIALVTPLLVLANALLSFADFEPDRSANRALLPAATTLRPLLAKPPQLNAAVQTLAIAHRAEMMQPQARIVAENTQLFLKFYAPFNVLEQSPDLTLILPSNSLPSADKGEAVARQNADPGGQAPLPHLYGQ